MFFSGKLKPLSDLALAKKEKALGLERCEAVLYPGPMAPSLPSNEAHLNTRALWAGLKPLDEKFYTVDHCQPMSQKQARLEIIQNMEDKYDYKHYSPINYSTLAYTTAASREDMSSPIKQGTFENVGFVVGDDDNNDRTLGRHCGVSRAAYLLGTAGGSGRSTISRTPTHHHHHQQQQQQHHYEMVAPRSSPAGVRRNMTLDRNGRSAPLISSPSSVTGVRLPALNSRHGRYALTALANGRHTLTRNQVTADDTRDVMRRSQVAIDRSGSAMTTLTPESPTDHVYASPITSPVI